jgi:hypothetical protein
MLRLICQILVAFCVTVKLKWDNLEITIFNLNKINLGTYFYDETERLNG